MSKITEINDCIREAIADLKRDRLQEPDITAALTIFFPKRMKGLLPNVKFGGCFIHQRPIADFGKGRGCEVGDFLVLCRKHGRGADKFNAALLQLKTTNRSIIVLSAEDAQLKLYTQWPQFSLRRIPDSSYDIQPKTVTNGAQYCIARNDKASIPLYVSVPNQQMVVDSDYTLGRFLWNFINFQSGRQISKESDKDSDDWSNLIWDLVGHSMHAVFNRRNIGMNNMQRLSGDFVCFLTNECLSFSNEDPNIFNGDFPNCHNHDDNPYSDANEGIGIPFLLIDVDESDFREQQ